MAKKKNKYIHINNYSYTIKISKIRGHPIKSFYKLLQSQDPEDLDISVLSDQEAEELDVFLKELEKEKLVENLRIEVIEEAEVPT